VAHEFPSELTNLAVAARDGDRLALSVFVRRTQPEVWRLCRRLGDAASADDLTQEVYVRAIAALPRFRADASARTWLLTIARHTCADHVRKAKRARSRAAERRDAPLVDPRSRDIAEADALGRLVDGLDEDRRVAFVLTQVLGLSYAEAAEVCAVPVGTIRSRVARARDDLVARLQDAAEA
jgi:RNA polymerase sigma-70 factor (ECF subfamily)